MFCPNLSDPNIKAQFESLQSIVPEYAYYLWDKYQGEVPAKYYNLSNAVRYQLSNQEKEYIASEKTIRDLAARMSDRIGIPVRFESDRSKQYKGKLEDNVAVVNLAYATLDTPIHEVLGHPIVRAIKNRGLDDRKVEVRKVGTKFQVRFTRPDKFIEHSLLYNTK